MLMQLFILLAGVIFFIVLVRGIRKSKTTSASFKLPANFKEILLHNVAFYKNLPNNKKTEFEARVVSFLKSVRITGVGASVEDLDRVLIGASAVIPIFAFPDWRYTNLNEVLLYPGTFNESFEQKGANRNVLGMVGSGPLNYTMILSQPSLREGFNNKADKNNTAIHEFVHLIDKTDGSTDGVAEVLLQHKYVLPWLDLMHKTVKEIMEGRSDINPYAATNQQEFFAVASEYFFERPDLMQSKHPELYNALERMFKAYQKE